MKKFFLALGILMVLSLVLAACGGAASSSNSVKVTMTDFAFDPATINVSAGKEAMLKACRYAYRMGFMGTSAIHPAWVEAANEGFSPPGEEVALAPRVKTALDEAYAQGEGSVAVDGRMYDVANMKYVAYLLVRAGAVEKRNAEKAAALAKAGGTVRAEVNSGNAKKSVVRRLR